MKCLLYLAICVCALSAPAQNDRVVCKAGEKKVRVFESADLKKVVAELRCNTAVPVMGLEANKAYRIRLSNTADGFVPLDNIQLGGTQSEPKKAPPKKMDKKPPRA